MAPMRNPLSQNVTKCQMYSFFSRIQLNMVDVARIESFNKTFSVKEKSK